MVNLKEPTSAKFWSVFFKQPIAILLFCTLLIFGILSGLKLVSIKNVSLRYIPFFWGKTLSAFETFGLGILLVLTFFFAYSLFRALRQRLLHFPTKSIMVKKMKINYYKVLFVINWLIHLMLAFFFGWLSGSSVVRESIWMGSGFILILTHGTTSYIKNDFNFF